MEVVIRESQRIHEAAQELPRLRAALGGARSSIRPAAPEQPAASGGHQRARRSARVRAAPAGTPGDRGDDAAPRARCGRPASAARRRRAARACVAPSTRCARAFDCDGVALHCSRPRAGIELAAPAAPGAPRAGDLRDCVSVPLLRGSERVGTLDLLARAGQPLRPGQLGLMRTASGALGSRARRATRTAAAAPACRAATRSPGCPTRARSARVLDDELARARRHGVPVASGARRPRSLRRAQRALRSASRATRCCAEARWCCGSPCANRTCSPGMGGDKFAVMLPETDRAPARALRRALRHALEDHRFARVGRVSASSGESPRARAAGWRASSCWPAAISALAVAKKAGRRRVAAFEAAPVH